LGYSGAILMKVFWSGKWEVKGKKWYAIQQRVVNLEKESVA